MKGLTMLEAVDDWELMVIMVSGLIHGEEVKCENEFLGGEKDIGSRYSNNGELGFQRA